jgi:hypothetical protein
MSSGQTVRADKTLPRATLVKRKGVDICCGCIPKMNADADGRKRKVEEEEIRECRLEPALRQKRDVEGRENGHEENQNKRIRERILQVLEPGSGSVFEHQIAAESD